MSPKNMAFLAYCYFLSTLISLIVEGSYFGFTATGTAGGTIAAEGTVINQLSAIQQLVVGGLVAIPAALITFTAGLFRMLIWDYSFYYGGWQIFRWFWLLLFSGAAVWGIATTFVPIFQNLLRFK